MMCILDIEHCTLSTTESESMVNHQGQICDKTPENNRNTLIENKPNQ